jgi:hypothetical protein
MATHAVIHPLALAAGVLFLTFVLLDAFQTVILPRRPVGHLRLTRLFFTLTWRPFRAVASGMKRSAFREQAISIYGPMSLLLLMLFWALLLLSAYALIYFGAGSPFADATHPFTVFQRLRSCFYLSGTTLFTLGIGDVIPSDTLARMLIVLEAGTGLAFIALVIGYVPVLYTAFSHREVTVALLDARAGSPPSAGELIARHNFNGGHHAMTALLAEWERWSAEMLESHISYPILCYYRSQHDNQSWLASITAILDCCALLITTVEGPSTRQAQLTFSIARHTLVDLGHVFQLDARVKAAATHAQQGYGRLPPQEFARLCDLLSGSGFSLCSSPDTRDRLATIRSLYEPQAAALAEYLLMDLPQWAPPVRDAARKPDQWTLVAGLRNPAAATLDRLTPHISVESVASSLDRAH